MKRRWRIFLNTGIIATATVLLLLSFEGVLRLCDYGYTGALFVRNSSDNRGNTYIVNKSFYARFFPAGDREWILTSGNWGWEITREKEPGTIRIFVLGGSVALGDQTDYAFSNARMLEVMLRRSFPGIRFEIFNLACGAVNSHAMRRVARQAMTFSPDFFVVYMGNNEYIGPYGPAWSPRGLPPNAVEVQRRISLQEYRVVQLLSWLYPTERYLISGGPQGVFEHTIKVRPSDPGRQTMYQSFEENLSGICVAAAESGATPILCTVGNNLRDWTPYASLHKEAITPEAVVQFEAHFRAGVEIQQHWESGTGEEVRLALDHYHAARGIDASYADLQFRLGECYWRLGEYDEARNAFTLARDYDGFAIRADTTINRIIRECAARHTGTVLADIEDLFVRKSENGIMGGQLFYDYVHVLFEGDYVIASGVYAQLKDVLGERCHRRPAAEMLSMEECKRALGMSPYLEALFLQRVLDEVEVSRVYNTRLDPSSLKERLKAAQSRITDLSFNQALQSLYSTDLYQEGDVHISRLLVELLQQAGRVDEAKKEAFRISEHFPNCPDARRIMEMIPQD